MRIVVQVPCLNEEETLPSVLQAIPDSIPGVDEILVLVIDDGSTDRTSEVARAHGADRVLRHTAPQGLARSFHDGVRVALEMGADILVNTDGDNQYPSESIGDLVAPIVAGEADIVVADRQVHLVEHFSRTKVFLQHLGSRVVSRVAGATIPDAASGFRAYSRESLMRLNSVTRFSYAMETIIQAGSQRLAIASVPIRTNPKTRESRLFKSTGQHVTKSAAAIIRSYIMYKPYTIFGFLAAVAAILGITPYVRYAILLYLGEQGGHLQSLLVGAVLLILAFLAGMLGIVSDLIRTNRILLEAGLEHAKRNEFERRSLGGGRLHEDHAI
ncbi:glycosyltransferase family 2 protein [Nocardioides sp. AE5]|uniref:glycosyltransferase family 2 protein n=1 Tax=Nocardioides sp. AE5 TaxID=2962573 RepID=UPI002882A438|nr:glycosyltransferase family 2 protein [Nocardioides sp. AE5]MDT0201187.1 glycosyltransferase family 2 protein [Nocardioides sp. AE5]